MKLMHTQCELLFAVIILINDGERVTFYVA